MAQHFFVCYHLISIHAPTRGATIYLLTNGKIFYFNPRSYKRSDYGWWLGRDGGIGISIHAPTRGATSDGNTITDFTSISIHAPTRGATKFSDRSIIVENISIHAPTRGATGIPSLPYQKKENFNPRSYKRSDIL